MTSHYVVAVFALMTACLATAGKLHSILHIHDILFNMFFLSFFSLAGLDHVMLM